MKPPLPLKISIMHLTNTKSLHMTFEKEGIERILNFAQRATTKCKPVAVLQLSSILIHDWSNMSSNSHQNLNQFKVNES